MAKKKDYKFTRINIQEEGSIGQVNFITEDKNGFIWMSEETGALIRYDGDNIKRYSHNPNDPNSLGGNYPECLLVDKDGFIWIGFFETGVDKFDPITETFTHFRHDSANENSISNDIVSTIIQDSKGHIYIGTMGGLTVLDQVTGKFTHYQHDPGDSTSISSNSVRKLYEDKMGNIWVGTGWYDMSDELGGLNRFDRETGKFQRFLAEPGTPNTLQHYRITAIFEDSQNNFWIGTGDNGLYLMDR